MQPRHPVVLAFGRFNPPTTGHEALVKFVQTVAQRVHGDVRLYPSQSQDPRKNPLPFRVKVQFMQKFFPGVTVSDNTAIRTPFDVFDEVAQLGYTDVIVVCGSDRVSDFEKMGAYVLPPPRNSPKYASNRHTTITNYTVVGVPGHRDPDAENVAGMSASKMRAAAANNDYASFQHGVPSHVTARDAKNLFQQVKQYMGLHESFNITRGQFTIELFEAAPRLGIPIKGHPYHKKSDNALRYIIKDAGEAALAMRGHNRQAEDKYLDQVNDASTVLAYRRKGGTQVTEAAISMNDQLRGARIIYKALAERDAPHGLVNPIDLINGAISEFLKHAKHEGRSLKQWATVGQMLTKAREGLHINWDETLFSAKERNRMAFAPASLDARARRGVHENVKLKQMTEDHVKVGDTVHSGLAQRGGAGFSGVVDRVDGDYVYINIGTDKYGTRIIKAPHRHVVKESGSGLVPAKPPTEIDRLRTTQQQELIALKTRQVNQTMAAKLRDVQAKARQAQMKVTQPKSAAQPAS